MAKYIYPAIFIKEDDAYNVNFPDIDGCYTFGNSFEKAIEMAKDVLSLMLLELEESGETIPKPFSSIVFPVITTENISVHNIECDTEEYKKEIEKIMEFQSS